MCSTHMKKSSYSLPSCRINSEDIGRKLAAMQVHEKYQRKPDLSGNQCHGVPTTLGTASETMSHLTTGIDARHFGASLSKR